MDLTTMLPITAFRIGLGVGFSIGFIFGIFYINLFNKAALTKGMQESIYKYRRKIMQQGARINELERKLGI